MEEKQRAEVEGVKQDTSSIATEKQSVESVPYGRFQELNNVKNKYKEELESLQSKVTQEAESRKMKEMEAKGEYDKIISDMKSKLEFAEKKANAFDQYQSSRRDSLLSKLPEDDRAIYGDLPLEKLEVHVDKFSTKPSTVPVDNSKPSSLGGYSSYEEWASVDPKGYKKANSQASNIKIGYGD